MEEQPSSSFSADGNQLTRHKSNAIQKANFSISTYTW